MAEPPEVGLSQPAPVGLVYEEVGLGSEAPQRPRPVGQHQVNQLPIIHDRGS